MTRVGTPSLFQKPRKGLVSVAAETRREGDMPQAQQKVERQEIRRCPLAIRRVGVRLSPLKDRSHSTNRLPVVGNLVTTRNMVFQVLLSYRVQTSKIRTPPQVQQKTTERGKRAKSDLTW